MNTVTLGLLVHIVDQLMGRRFLVETGASYSIFPHQSSSPLFGPSLTGPRGKWIPCWGKQQMELSIHGRHFVFVQFAIIGVDFLHSHQLLVDPAANRLVETASLQDFATVSASTAAACAACRGNQQDSRVSPSSAAADVEVRQDSSLSPLPVYLKILLFIAGVFDTSDKHSFANISANFSKKLKRSYWDT